MSYKNFESTGLVDEGIKEKNYDKIRCALTGTCYFDRTFTKGKFQAGLEYVAKQGVNIFEPYDPQEGALFGDRIDRKDPTLEEDDFAAAIFRLTENFCQERIDDTIKLGRYLFPQEMQAAKEQAAAKQSAKPQSQKVTTNPQQGGQMAKIVIPLAAALIVAAVVIYLFMK